MEASSSRVEYIVWDARHVLEGGSSSRSSSPSSSEPSPIPSPSRGDLERAINTFIDGVSGEASYVWQCGSPLRVSLNRRGSLRFGVNMDDEWYVVYLLRRVSEAFDVAVQVWDEDGEFLLIEAAYSLPGWLEPAVAANRVWVYRGAVHCLPRGEKNGGIDVSSAEGALKSLVVHAAAAKACGAGIEACVARRVARYPGLAKETMMRATACLPRRVASALTRDPQLVGRMVAAYVESSGKGRASAARRVAEGAGGAGGAEGLVPMIVVFNRLLYGQVMYSHDKGAVDGLMARCGPYGRQEGEGEGEEEGDAARAAAMTLGFRLALGGVLVGIDIDGVEETPPTTPTEDIPLSTSYTRDDDSWLHEPSARLEEALDERERELGGHVQGDGSDQFNPDELTGRMRQFVETMSSMEGAVVEDEEVAFDPEAFLSILRGEFAMEDGGEDHSEDEGSSFYDMSGDEEGDEEEDDGIEAAMAAELREKLVGGEVEDEPLSVDIAVVENLLSSVEIGEKEGAAGPAKTLAGLLGVDLS